MIKFTPNDYNSRINTNFKANDKKDKKMDDIQELVRKVIDEAELKVTDVGPFSVKEEQKDTDPCHFLSSFGVIIKPLSSSDDKSPRVKRHKRGYFGILKVRRFCTGFTGIYRQSKL